MLQKISYDVIFNPSKYSRAGEGMLMVRASQGRKSVDIPTNIYCESRQFSNGYINSLHPQFDGLNAMLNQIILEIQQTEIEAFRRDINMTVQRLYSMYVESLSTTVPLAECKSCLGVDAEVSTQMLVDLNQTFLSLIHTLLS